jgi:hypothetical protein
MQITTSRTMLYVVLIGLAVHFAESSPIQRSGNMSDSDVSQSACTDLSRCRSLWNIIWSCLATVLSCALVALHPNIPGTDEDVFPMTIRLVKMMIMVVTAPEFLIFWALLQWNTACVLAERYSRTWKVVSFVYQTADFEN